jgi:hypothetical protein
MITGDIFYKIIILTLFNIGIISFVLFIRRLLVNSYARKSHNKEIEVLLDKIINSLEKEKVN